MNLNNKEKKLISKLLEDRLIGPAEVAKLDTTHWVVGVARAEVKLIYGIIDKLELRS